MWMLREDVVGKALLLTNKDHITRPVHPLAGVL